MPPIVLFILGVFVGTFIGIFIMALVVVSSGADATLESGRRSRRSYKNSIGVIYGDLRWR